jgi:glycosyltransferase involved in cell wall biosynthesis
VATFNLAGPIAALRLARHERVDLFVENICKIPFLLPAITTRPVLPIVLHLLGYTVFYETNPAFASYVWLCEKLIPRVYRGLRIVSISKSTERDLARRGVRASRVDIVSPGLDLGAYQDIDVIPRSAEPLVVYLGMLKRYKGIDMLIRSFARVNEAIPAARLALIGKGNDRNRLEALSRSMGLGRAVTFTGFVTEEEKINWLRRAHVVVCPSLKEGWGIPAMEAAACGTAVVASDVDGLRDAVHNGITGLLVPHSDVAGWAHCIVRLLEDGALRERLGTAARERAGTLAWDVQAERMQAIVEEVAAPHPSPAQGPR